MSESIIILKGNIVYSKNQRQLEIFEQSYLVCKDKIVEGVYKTLPKYLEQSPVIDYKDSIIIPGFTDLHIHAPQYAFRGFGMDMELLDWLDMYTFPEEGKYSNLEYAKKAYEVFTNNLKLSATTRACIFATVHNEATLLLMDLLEKSGLNTYVGKVNMDRNCPDYLSEKTAKEASENTITWIRQVANKNYNNTKPILTPRFIPSCSDELMKEIETIQKDYKLPVQSHLSENPGEIQWVKELCPWSKYYGDAYNNFGLFGGECKTVMAHCIYSTDEEIEHMKKNGVFVAHCPESNSNLSSGIAPIRMFLEKGIHVGLGSDVAGGTTENMFRAMSHAIQVSKLRWRLQDNRWKPLGLEEVFYMATKGGGEFFGKVGSFEKGYEFDAVVINDENMNQQGLTIEQRLERIIYLADERHIQSKYVKGKQLF